MKVEITKDEKFRMTQENDRDIGSKQ